jgi:transcriptional regulator with XRE-family HTH domain
VEEQTVNQRLERLVEHFFQGNKSAFAKAIGVSSQGLGEILGGRQSAPSFSLLQKLFSAYPQVRMQWLILGEGPMLVTHSNSDDIKNLQDKIDYANQDYKVKYERLQLANIDKQRIQERHQSAVSEQDKLPEKNYELLVLYEIAVKAASDYAAVLAESVQASRMHLASLHLQLSELIKKSDFAPEDYSDLHKDEVNRALYGDASKYSK